MTQPRSPQHTMPQPTSPRWRGVARWLLLTALLLAALWLPPHTRAEPEQTPQAGLVIQFADGDVQTFCVELGADGSATGEEVLRATGLEAAIEYSGNGGAVCMIDNVGCDFPAESCFCECTLDPNEPCVYWNYSFQENGEWQYASIGSTNRAVEAGDVEGWVWGAGEIATGALPPLVPFDDICLAPTPTATRRPTQTRTATPTASATATLVPTATETEVPASATRTLAASATPATATVAASATRALPSATIAATSTDRPVVFPSPTPVPPTNTARAPLASATPLTDGTALPTPSPAPSATSTVALPTLPATATTTPRGTSESMPQLASAPTPTVGSIAVAPSGEGKLAGESRLVATPTVGSAADSGSSPLAYLLFGGIVVLLGAALFMLRGQGR